MSQIYNIYCDESCHLEHDHQKVMVLGAVWCPLSKTTEIHKRIREIKIRHGLKADTEVKWVKVAPNKLDLYRDLVDYFFDDDDLHFRAVVVQHKSRLDHARYQQDHDLWYYKMYFRLLSVLLDPESSYRIYLDIKDTRSQDKVRKLTEVLRNDKYDFSKRIIMRVQQVRSHEVALIQLVDVLIGAVSYVNRGLVSSESKIAVVDRIRQRTKHNYTLIHSTLLREEKVNIFVWEPDWRRDT